MSDFQTLYYADKLRNNSGHALRFIWYFRHYQTSTGFARKLFGFLMNQMKLKYGLEISGKARIGKGVYLGHAFNITVNPNAEIGNFCNLHKGVTIGQQNRGKRKGVPKIGDYVWIGVNATIVGNVMIGDDVLVAPGAYVNCDVPSHSIVIGNPCQIHHRDNATEGYINNCS